jgi:hypothetical protein
VSWRIELVNFKDLAEQKYANGNGTPNLNQAKTFSSILKNKENEQLIKKMARREVKAVDSVEKNIVVSGIKKIVSNEEEITTNDKKQVDEVLDVLQLKRNDVELQRRVKTRNESANIIIVKFKELRYHTRALQNSGSLKRTQGMEGVYINRDRTRAERMDEKEARDNAKLINAVLTEVDQEGRRFGVDENKKR